MQQQLITPNQVVFQPAHAFAPVTPIPMQINPTMQQMMQYNSQKYLNNYNKSSAEQKACELNKRNQSIIIQREEQSMQLFWDFKAVTQQSHIRDHQLNRRQLNCLNLIFIYPLKICLCSHRIPNDVENQQDYPNLPYFVTAGPSCGYLSVGGEVLGYYQLENPSLLCQCCCGETPIVHITNAVTKEKSLLKTQRSCVSSCLECCLPCFALSRDFVDEKGKTSTYNRSFESEIYKLLQYGAFIFFQEYFNNLKGCLIC
ncbi:hypothetical protein ABPG72_005120 [Tetrahymena utriculariae]